MAEKEKQYTAELQEDENTEKVVAIDRISRTVAGGRRIRFRALIVIGSKGNQVGVGIAKGADVQKAIQKAKLQAKKTLISVPVTDNGSIPRQVDFVYGNTKVILKPAPEGHSIIAGGTVRAVLERAGIKNIVSKTLGSSNKLNTIMATYMALGKLSGKRLPIIVLSESETIEDTEEETKEPKVKTKTGVKK